MNRQLKFRVWDGKKMLLPEYSDVTVFLINPEGHLMRYNEGGEDIRYLPEWDIMQFTGLKDKNGKDIYEGDILSIMLRKKYGHAIDGVRRVVGAVEFGCVYVIDDTLNAFDAFNVAGRSIRYLMGNELEVVGNIFENKDLIP